MFSVYKFYLPKKCKNYWSLFSSLPNPLLLPALSLISSLSLSLSKSYHLPFHFVNEGNL